MLPGTDKGVNGKHHTHRDPKPQINRDKLTIINMRYCPFASRTILVMLKKGLEFDTFNVSLVEKPQWFLDMTPTGSVPVIQHGDFIGRESNDLSHYIDEKYPEPKLGPSTPEHKVLDSNLTVDFGRNIVGPEVKVWMSKDIDGRPAAIEAMFKGLKWLDEVLTKNGRGPFFAIGRKEADGPGLIDYNLWPFFNHLRGIPDIGITEIDFNNYPNIKKWLELMDADSAVKQYMIPRPIFAKYMKEYQAGKTTQYDGMLEE